MASASSLTPRRRSSTTSRSSASNRGRWPWSTTERSSRGLSTRALSWAMATWSRSSGWSAAAVSGRRAEHLFDRRLRLFALVPGLRPFRGAHGALVALAGEQPAFRERPQLGQRARQRSRAVGEVDEDAKRLAEVHPLEPSAHPFERREAGADRLERHAEGEAHRGRAHRVVNIEARRHVEV